LDKAFRDEIYVNAKKWILEAGNQIRNKINEPRVISIKSNPNDLVTEMDREIELFFISKIQSTYPSHEILGEEGQGDKVTTLDGVVWIVDPIDGTMNFVHQKKNFAISIGIYHDGIGEIGLIYDVMADELYHAKRAEGAYKNEKKLPQLTSNLKLEKSLLALNHHFLMENTKFDYGVMHQLIRTVRGNRSYGSAALEFAYVAEGTLGGYLSMRLAPWDIAAGMVIVNEVGGVTSNLYGEDVDMLGTNTILTCNKAIESQLLAVMKEGRK
jgi:myo-inositol-1(or 4)-monophosphatase